MCLSSDMKVNESTTQMWWWATACSTQLWREEKQTTVTVSLWLLILFVFCTLEILWIKKRIIKKRLYNFIFQYFVTVYLHVCTPVSVTWSWWCSVSSRSYSCARPLDCLFMASTSAWDLCTAAGTNSPTSIHCSVSSKLHMQDVTCSGSCFLWIIVCINTALLCETECRARCLKAARITHPRPQSSVDLPALPPLAAVAGPLMTWTFPLPGAPEHKGFSLITELKWFILTAENRVHTK